jgi:hypothetical protein
VTSKSCKLFFSYGSCPHILLLNRVHIASSWSSCLSTSFKCDGILDELGPWITWPWLRYTMCESNTLYNPKMDKPTYNVCHMECSRIVGKTLKDLFLVIYLKFYEEAIWISMFFFLWDYYTTSWRTICHSQSCFQPHACPMLVCLALECPLGVLEQLFGLC